MTTSLFVGVLICLIAPPFMIFLWPPVTAFLYVACREIFIRPEAPEREEARQRNLAASPSAT